MRCCKTVGWMISASVLGLPPESLTAAADNRPVEALLYGLYLGTILTLIVYGGAQAFMLRSRMNLYFAFINLSVLLATLFAFGPVFRDVRPEDAAGRLGGLAFFGLLHAAALCFTRDVLQLKKRHPALNVAVRTALWLQLTAVGAAAVFPSAAYRLFLLNCAAVHALMCCAGLAVPHRRFRTAKSFYAVWGVFALSAAAAALAGMSPVRPPFEWISRAAPAMLAFVLSWGITGDILRMRKEKEWTENRLSESMRLAETDEVTGLKTRGYVQRMFKMLTLGRPERELSLLMIDVDHFKRINDTYGHEAGDIVLRELGVLMRGSLARTDVIGRFGGEEFVVLLPDTALDGARAAASRLVDAVRHHKFAVRPDLSVGCSISVGIAQWKDGETFQQLLNRADAAMYHAKREGRDRASVYKETFGV